MSDRRQEPQDRLIAEVECRLLSGVSRAHRWRLEREKKFPARVSLGPKTVRWRLGEVLAWMAALPTVEGSPKPIPKSANLRPRVSQRAMSEAKDRAALAESEASSKASRRRRKTRPEAAPSAPAE
jgi:prophage regulatory protein